MTGATSPSPDRRAPITLINGQALIPDDQRGHLSEPGGTGPTYDGLDELDAPTFGDFEGQTPSSIADDAAIPLWCNNNGGTADGALLVSVAVYSARSGTPRYVGLITPHQQPAGVLPTLLSNVAMSPGLITVEEHWYGPKDGTCCPSGENVTTCRFAQGQLAYVATKVVTPAQ